MRERSRRTHECFTPRVFSTTVIYGWSCFYNAKTQEKGVIIGTLSVLKKRHNTHIKNYFEGADSH